VHLLIVKTSSLGDVIHALPLVSDLARVRPQARIDWAVEEAFAAIPRLHPAVAQVIPVALRRWRRSLWRPATWGEVAQARARLREADYDLVLDCQGLVKSALVARWAQAPVAGPDRRSAREPLAARAYSRPVGLDRSLHAVARNRALGAAALGYSIDGEPPRFGLAAGSVPAALAAQVAAPYAVLLTNASRSSKLWPDERWTAVAAALAGRGWASLLFWGSDEEGERTRARAAGMQRAQPGRCCRTTCGGAGAGGGGAGAGVMRPPGRPAGESWRAQREGSPITAPGRSPAPGPQRAARRAGA